MKNSKISWTDHTFNGWLGCSHVSPGCEHCYAEALNHRMKWTQWGSCGKRKRTSAAYWRQPFNWDHSARSPLPDWLRIAWEKTHVRPRVFCGSMCDWLDDQVPVAWLVDLLALIHATPNLDWLMLSKRPENWYRRMDAAFLNEAEKDEHNPNALSEWIADWIKRSNIPENIWIGTSVEDQERLEQRSEHLVQIPAKVHFLSCEPLLGPLDFEGDVRAIADWLIAGGESGPKARPMNPAWARSLRDQCVHAGVPFFYKQDGGLHHGGGMLDGHEWKEFPIYATNRNAGVAQNPRDQASGQNTGTAQQGAMHLGLATESHGTE